MHYETIQDLLAETSAHMNEQFLAYMKKDSQAFIEKIATCSLKELYLVTPQYLTPYLNYIKEHKRLFRMAVENAMVLGLDSYYKRMFQHVIVQTMQKCVPYRGEDRRKDKL